MFFNVYTVVQSPKGGYMCVKINKQIRNRLGFQTVAAMSNSIFYIQ